MKILFLSGLFPEQSKDEILNQSKGVIQFAANSLQWNFVKGFDNFIKTDIISLPFIGSFPFLYKKIYLRSIKFEHIIGADDICLSFINLPLLKQFFRYSSAKKELVKRLSNSNEDVLIFIYSVNSPFLKAVVDVKNKFPNIKIILIVPDLPEFMSDSKNVFYKFLKKIDSKVIKSCLKKVDSFVLLTDTMADALNVTKPWVRVEGIFDNSSDTKESRVSDEIKTILYTGTLAKRYGIKNLVDAFNLIDSINYRLLICGEGDYRNEIELNAQKDFRIRYLGQLPNDQILELQRKATVLVNPRTSEGNYTKYSFPSKTMEYLASGTPTILYKLDGIPEEYFPYCYIPNDESILSLKEIIIKVCEKPKEELEKFGNSAKIFVHENKNPKAQVSKIISMLNLKNN